MPKASRDSASNVRDMGVMERRYQKLGGYTVGFAVCRRAESGQR
jgi:hypothetical protein